MVFECTCRLGFLWRLVGWNSLAVRRREGACSEPVQGVFRGAFRRPHCKNAHFRRKGPLQPLLLNLCSLKRLACAAVRRAVWTCMLPLRSSAQCIAPHLRICTPCTLPPT